MKSLLVKIILLGIVLGGIVYGGFYLLEHRHEYFFKGDGIKIEEEFGNKDVMDNGSGKEDGDVKGTMDMEENDNDEDELDEKGDYFAPAIHKSDCINECKNRKAVKIEYEYCREVCGLNEIEENTLNNQTVDSGNNLDESEAVDECEDAKNAFEQDVCWKIKAVREKNASYCENISDEKMSTVCENRVLEEVLN